MTVSTMRCCGNPVDLVRAALFALCLMIVGTALAGEIGLRDIRLQPADDGSALLLSTSLAFDIGPRLEEAVGKGLTLHFVAEFELTRRRWYWFDEKVVQARQTWRLSYHALTRQYRFSSGVLPQSFASLDEALRALAHLHNWSVADRETLAPFAGETLDAALRVRLDTSQLPKPFQVEAFSNKDWNLASDWKRWAFTVPAIPAASATPAPPLSTPASPPAGDVR